MVAIEPRVFKKSGKQRRGKGFSREEIKKAGSNPKQILKLGIRLDLKRRTAHEENVEVLKAFLMGRKPVAKTKRKTKSELD